MSPVCGHLSVFRGKRSVLVSLEGSAGAGPVASGLRHPRLPRSRRPQVRTPRGFSCPPPCLAGSPASPARHLVPRSVLSASPVGTPASPVRCFPRLRSALPRLRSALPCSRQSPRCPGSSVRARPPAGPAGRRARAARPGCGPPGQTANMTLVSVNGSRSRPGPGQRRRPGWRCTVAYRLRSVTSPGKRADGAPRPPLISLRCGQFVTHLKHIAVALTLTSVRR